LKSQLIVAVTGCITTNNAFTLAKRWFLWSINS
jgi:hypothetical protein